MSNHFHLAVELTEPNLSVSMKWLQGTWIWRYNGFRGLIGHPFQGRYKALLTEPGEAFGEAERFGVGRMAGRVIGDAATGFGEPVGTAVPVARHGAD